MDSLWIGLIAAGAVLVVFVAVVIVCCIWWRKRRSCCQRTKDDVENQAATIHETGAQNVSSAKGHEVQQTILDETIRNFQRTSLDTDKRGRSIQLQRLEGKTLEQRRLQQRLGQVKVEQCLVQERLEQQTLKQQKLEQQRLEQRLEEQRLEQQKLRGRSRERNLNKTRHRSESGDFSRQREVTDPAKTIDLHRMSVQDAMYKFTQFLKNMENDYHNTSYRRVNRFVHVITGRGLHSEGGIPKIKPNVQNYLDKHNYDNKWKNNGGMVTIDLLSKRRNYM